MILKWGVQSAILIEIGCQILIFSIEKSDILECLKSE